MVTQDSPNGLNSTKRYVAESAERQLFLPYPVKQGSIELVDYMGGDEGIVRTATLGYGTSIFPETPDLPDFLSYLQSKGVTKPFKTAQLKLRFEAPLFVASMFVHEPTASVNEYSGRYSEMISSSDIPTLDSLLSNIGNEEKAIEALKLITASREDALRTYQRFLEMDFARELSRTVLETSNDTIFFWKNDLLSIYRLIEQRRKQFDVNSVEREYIEALAETTSKAFPEAWNALSADIAKDINLTYPKDIDVVDNPLRGPSWSPKQTRREVSPELEEILFVPINFLDHGLVQPVDYMGTDVSPAQAARVSYGTGTKQLQDDIKLARSLVRDNHSSPLEMAELQIEFTSPYFSDPRQAARHRTLDTDGFMGVWMLGDTFYMPDDTEIKFQDRVNRQGRGKHMSPEQKDTITQELEKRFTSQIQTAEDLSELGVPEEISRRVKGVGFYTSGWRTGDVLNYLRFFKLRSDPHAQLEVREESLAIEKIVQAHVPNLYQAASDYMLRAMTLSTMEQEQLVKALESGDIPASEEGLTKTPAFSMTTKDGKVILNREGKQLIAKIRKLKGQ